MTEIYLFLPFGVNNTEHTPSTGNIDTYGIPFTLEECLATQYYMSVNSPVLARILHW